MYVKQTNTNKGGVGFAGLLQIAFIVLKLCGVIDWSWWLVMLPAIVSVAFLVLWLGVVLWLVKS